MELTRQLHKELMNEKSKHAKGRSVEAAGNGDSDIHFFGIDVDENLVKNAEEKLIEEEANPSTKNNIQFQTLNIMDTDHVDEMFNSFLKRLNKPIFDVIFCFSVTMWIHLNHGDRGLEHFFKTVIKWCRYLVLEPQPWKCYRTASRRMRRSNQPEFEHIEQISNKCEKLLPYIVSLCEKCGFQTIYQFGETNWKRKIILFRSTM